MKLSRITLRLAIPVVAACAIAHSSNTDKKTATASPRISATFSKAAVRALSTIDSTRNKQLLDAAMIDLSTAQSTHTELQVVWHIQLFEEIHRLHDAAAGHDEDRTCIIAWLPKLRGLSAEIPKQCPRLSAEEMKEVSQP